MVRTSGCREASTRIIRGAFAFAELPLTLCFCTSVFLILAGLSACADLSAVAKFATTAKDATKGFSEIAQDFAGSATRRSLYVSDEERPPVSHQAEEYRALEPDMQATQKVLSSYISALAAIATDTTSKDRDASIKTTESSLKKAGLSAGQAAAGVGLATKVADALTAGYRSNKAAKVIHECNPFLQDYLKGLEHIVGTDYVYQLGIEQSSAESYYQDLRHRYAAKEPMAEMLTERVKRQELHTIAQKRKAATAYVKVLTDIGEAHQKLDDGGQHMSKREMLKLVEPYVEDIVTESQKVAKAF